MGIIATTGTVQSEAFVREIKKAGTTIKVFQQACPLLVPIIEAGEQNHPATKLILESYLKIFKTKNIDTLILGCTHYGLIENKIKKILGKKVNIISEARVVPKKLKLYLQKHKEIEKVLKKNSYLHFYSTDLTKTFSTLGSIFFGKKIKVQKITLE